MDSIPSSSSSPLPAPNADNIPLNLAMVHKPYKNPHYSAPKKVKNLKQILTAEKALILPMDLGTCAYALTGLRVKVKV